MHKIKKCYVKLERVWRLQDCFVKIDKLKKKLKNPKAESILTLEQKPKPGKAIRLWSNRERAYPNSKFRYWEILGLMEQGETHERWLEELGKKGAYSTKCRSTLGINTGIRISILYVRIPGQERRMITEFQKELAAYSKTAREYSPTKGTHVPFRTKNGSYCI
jgi:hypothetical protein